MAEEVLTNEEIAKAINDSPEPHGKYFGKRYIGADITDGHRAISKATVAKMKRLGYGRPDPEAPKVVCLCGSTRFVDTFNEWRKHLTLEGKIVLSIELVLPQSEREDPQDSNYKVKQALDELHLRKIDLSDEVMILNVGGYIGESTTNEINYAKSKGKPIEYLECIKQAST